MTFQISRGNHRADAGVKHRTLKLLFSIYISLRLPWWLSGKEYACNAGDPDSIPGSGRENGDPLQYSCLENPMDRGAWQTTVHMVTKSQTRQKNLTHTHCKLGYSFREYNRNQADPHPSVCFVD